MISPYQEEFVARVRQSQLPRNLKEAQLRGRIANAEMHAQEHQDSIGYHNQRWDQLLDEIGALRAELWERGA